MKWPMRLIEGEAVARFVSDRLGFAVCPPYTTLGIEREGEIVGGVIFNCFEGASVHVTLAGTGWTRGFLMAVGGYVYNQLGCLRMTVTTENPQVAVYAERIGGRRDVVIRSHFWLGRDASTLGIFRYESLSTISCLCIILVVRTPH